MKFLISIFMLVAFASWAGEKYVLPAGLADIYAQDGDVQTVTVEVLLGNGNKNPSWNLTTTETAVLIGKLTKEPQPNIDDSIYAQLDDLDNRYQGLRVTMFTYEGGKLPVVKVHNRSIFVDGTKEKKDSGRELEIWLFGTSKNLKNRLTATQVMPIFTFDQCKELGNLIINTTPRQCLLPDNNLLLEVPDRPSLESLKIKNFKSCLKNGKAIIDVFPRRCMAQGGRVFTEPPQIPKYEGLPKGKDVNIDEFLKEYKTSPQK